LIENTTKSVRRKETIDDAYILSQYKEVTSLYRLDQITLQGGSVSSEKGELGELPQESCLLITALIAIWVLLAAYCLNEFLRKKRAEKNRRIH